MSINIFQYLKQGTALSRKSLQKNAKLRQEIIPKKRQKNNDFEASKHQKFNFSDSSSEQQPDTYDAQQLDYYKKRKETKIHMLRKQLGIKAQGHDIPLILTNFTKGIKKYKIKSQLVKGLGQLGYRKPTPVQCQVIPCMLEKRNVLVTAPTGTGKTLSYLLPLLQNLKSSKFIKAVIISPLQQLSNQILKQLETLASGINQGKSIISYKCISALTEQQKSQIKHSKSPGFNILITTPMTFINTFQEHRKLLKNVQYLVLDQCDKYFQKSFLDQIKAIMEFFLPYNPLYSLFSATIQHPVEQLLKSEFLEDCIRIEVGGKNKVLKSIKQSLQYCTNQSGKLMQLKNIILEGQFIPPVLIFVQQKARAKQLLFELRKILKDNVQVSTDKHLHGKVQLFSGDKSKQERQEILNKFDNNEFWVLITTDIIARGIDFKNVNLVINYDFPNSILTYIHRVGRTGRANRQGTAVTLFTDEDKPLLKSLGNLLSVSGCNVPQWIMNMQKPSKKLIKKLQQFPVKRLPVGVGEKKDPEWQKKLDKIQKRFLQKHQKQDNEMEDQDDGWQVVGSEN